MYTCIDLCDGQENRELEENRQEGQKELVVNRVTNRVPIN